jgi:hypothetical protein
MVPSIRCLGKPYQVHRKQELKNPPDRFEHVCTASINHSKPPPRPTLSRHSTDDPPAQLYSFNVAARSANNLLALLKDLLNNLFNDLLLLPVRELLSLGRQQVRDGIKR